jgi:hypothetical protein
MNKKGRISRSLSVVLIAASLSTFALIPHGAVGQGRAKKPKVVYYGDFVVRVLGKGRKESQHLGDPLIQWSIARKYTSRMELTGPYPFYRNSTRTSRGVLVPTSEEYKFDVSKSNPWKVHVKVNDLTQRFWEGPGEIRTRENKKQVTIWEEDAVESGVDGMGASLFIDKKNGTHFVTIGLVPDTPAHNVRMRQWLFVERSAAGFGGKPTSEFFVEAEELVSINSLSIPLVPPLVPIMTFDYVGSQAVLRHLPWLTQDDQRDEPLPDTYPDKIERPQKCYTPSAPMIAGVPDSQTNVKVCIEYRFSKTPLAD